MTHAESAPVVYTSKSRAMSRQRYPEEFKIEAFKQVNEKGKPVAQPLGMSMHRLTPGSKSTASPKSSVSKTTVSRPNCASYALNSSA